MNKKTVVTLISIIVIAGVLYKGKTLLQERQETIKNEPTPLTKIDNVELISAKQKMIQNTESYLAELLATKEISLSTKLPGFIKEIYVHESMPVTKGTLLLSIDNTEILSNIKALKKTQQMQESDYEAAKATYQRNKKLYNAGGLSKEKLDLSLVALEAKEAQLENTKQKIVQLKNQNSYLQIRAPFDGTIERLFMHKGDLAPTAKPILTMSNKKQKILFSYPKKSSHITLHNPLLYNGEKIAEVSTIYNSANNGLSVAEAQLISNIDMPLHSNINIEIVTDEKNGCVVPKTTLIHEKDAIYILTMKDQQFSKQKVNILLQNSNEALISPCTNMPIASAPEVKLKALLAYDKVEIKGESDE